MSTHKNRKIMHKCIDCGKERLVELRGGRPCNLRCRLCAAKYRAITHIQLRICVQCGKNMLVYSLNGYKLYCSSQCRKEYLIQNVPINAQVKRLAEDYKATQGEIRTGTELQLLRRDRKDAGQYMWAPCAVCGVCRWVVLKKTGELKSKLCPSCSSGKKGSQSHSWKGGRWVNNRGYIMIRLPEGDFYLSTTRKGRGVLEHRLVMAKHLGRCLAPFEVVHHKNGVRDDNRIENLELSTQNAHTKDHHRGYRDGYAKGLVDGRNAQIEELRKEIRLLRWEHKEAERIK